MERHYIFARKRTNDIEIRTSSLKPMCIPQSNMMFLPPMDSSIQLRPTSEVYKVYYNSQKKFTQSYLGGKQVSEL